MYVYKFTFYLLTYFTLLYLLVYALSFSCQEPVQNRDRWPDGQVRPAIRPIKMVTQ